jgi:pimeloyl-ACP methyl ester carboxylesterase
VTTGRVAVGGLDLAYEEHGRGARALVLVHGFTGSRRDFAPRLPELAALGRTVAVDLRGHGGSGRAPDPSAYTLERLADDLVGFLDAMELAGCDLLGHSMGGMVALRAALEAPGRLGSLLLMDTAARAPDLPIDPFRLAARVVREAGLATLAELLRRRGPDDPLRTAADRRLEAAWGEGYWNEWRLPNFGAMDPAAYEALGESIFAQERLDARLAALDLPTLVMVGEGDEAFLAPADELCAAIPRARRVTIADAGHQPQLENPSEWLAAIRAHLARVRRPTDFPPS